MSDTTSDGVATDDVSDVKSVSKESTSGDSVSYDTYKRTVSEVKKLKESLKEAQALKDRLAELEQNEQMRQGKHEETIASLRAELDKAKKSERGVFQKFAIRSLSAQVKEEAMKHGCVDPDAVMKLVDLSELEVDGDTFEADKEKIAEMISDLKSKKAYLFNKPAPKINGALPNGDRIKEGSKMPDFKKMTAPEIQDWLNKNR